MIQLGIRLMPGQREADVAAFVRRLNPAGQPFAGIELAVLGDPSGTYTTFVAAGHIDPAAMAAAIDDFNRWSEEYDPDWPARPTAVWHTQVALTESRDGAGLCWAPACPDRVHAVTVMSE